MEKEQIENILTKLLSTGADFSEVFLENKTTKVFNYIDSMLDSLSIGNIHGLGLRIAKDNNVYYACTNNFDELDNVIDKLTSNIDSEVIYKNVVLNDLKEYKNDTDTHYSDLDIKNKLKSLDELIRSKCKKISQVSFNVQQVMQDVVVANNSGIYSSENRIRSRIYITINFQDGDNVSDATYSKGFSTNYDFLDDIDYEQVIDDLIKEGLDKLYAKPCVGKVMPVVIESGFGGVIFHEACGHAMEATSVADGLSVLSHDLNKQVASNVVSITDDGTIDKEWGTTKIDDEGYPTRKNILIKDGVLNGYLIDTLNTRKMGMPATGSSRRESYKYAPTSRMNNTYLEVGNDSFEDMIKSIDMGVYAKKMGGGCVSPETGDFNFACNLAYMIRDGKIAECVKGASLIGNTKQILSSVDMVSNNLELGQGMCGSLSGWVPVNVGMPSIKVSNILVGGTNE